MLNLVCLTHIRHYSYVLKTKRLSHGTTFKLYLLPYFTASYRKLLPSGFAGLTKRNQQLVYLQWSGDSPLFHPIEQPTIATIPGTQHTHIPPPTSIVNVIVITNQDW
jgi:hypothetical protein